MFPFDLFDFDEDGIIDPEEENFGVIMASVIMDDEDEEDEDISVDLEEEEEQD